jgi:hypothetical protein
MPASTEIQFFDNGKIDKQRYDECIKKCKWGLIYAHSFYVDSISPWLEFVSN